MIELPEEDSLQKTIAFTLGEKIDKDQMVTLMKGDESLISFVASKSFKTVIISTSDIENGVYKLYKGINEGKEYGILNSNVYTKDMEITVNNETLFKVENIVNYFKSK